MSEKRDYPQWVCLPCGAKFGRCVPSMACWHEGQCGVCDQPAVVTEPRDFGHLAAGWQWAVSRGVKHE
jgi:hypothetical protein